jgi:hypothetical protein
MKAPISSSGIKKADASSQSQTGSDQAETAKRIVYSCAILTAQWE